MPLVNCLINGQKKMDLAIEDRAIHYGDGVFETMLYHQGEISLWPQHMSRLKAGCDVLNLSLYDEEQLLNDLKALTKDLKGTSYIVKLMITRGSAGRGLNVDKSTAVSCIFLAYDFDINALKNQQVKMLTVCKTRLLENKTLGGLKHLNRLLYVLAANELSDDLSEGIMLNDKNEMIECITHNLFFVKNATLYTAPIVNCGVAGIKRQQVLDTAKQIGLNVKIEAILLVDLKQMDECFITNAVVGVQSVHSINHVIFSQNSMTHQLQATLNQI